MLDKIQLEEIVPSSRKYPFISFKAEREIGNDLLTVENPICKDWWWNYSWQHQLLSCVQVTKTALIGQRHPNHCLDPRYYGWNRIWRNCHGELQLATFFTYQHYSADFAGGESILDWPVNSASKEEDDNTFLRGFWDACSSLEMRLPSLSTSCQGKSAWCFQTHALRSQMFLYLTILQTLDLESLQAWTMDWKSQRTGSSLSRPWVYSKLFANHTIVLFKKSVSLTGLMNLWWILVENQEVQAKS